MLVRYPGCRIAAWSDTTGYVFFAPPRGWDGATPIQRHFSRMKRQAARLVTYSQRPPF